jgi:ubiquinone/menaquinone biosynthesis C-methylase UbiE
MNEPNADPLAPIDYGTAEFVEFFDELPLWSAPFGLSLLEHVPLRPDLTALDVGAGTGFLTIELAERCGPGCRVIAVDPWGVAIARLRRKVERRGLGNITLIEADAATLDLPRESVDLVVSNLGINNFDDPPAVLEVCRGLMKPGATLLLTTNLVGHMEEFYAVFRDTLIELGRSDRLPLFDEHVAHRGTAASVSALLEQAGFKVTGLHRDSFRWRFADGTALLRHHFIRLGFLPAWKQVAPPEAIPETFALLERRLNEVAAVAGELALTIPMACLVAVKPG